MEEEHRGLKWRNFKFNQIKIISKPNKSLKITSDVLATMDFKSTINSFIPNQHTLIHNNSNIDETGKKKKNRRETQAWKKKTILKRSETFLMKNLASKYNEQKIRAGDKANGKGGFYSTWHGKER